MSLDEALTIAIAVMRNPNNTTAIGSAKLAAAATKLEELEKERWPKR